MVPELDGATNWLVVMGRAPVTPPPSELTSLELQWSVRLSVVVARQACQMVAKGHDEALLGLCCQ